MSNVKIKLKEDGVLKKTDCFFCYSLKLNDFLQQEKVILPISAGFNKSSKKAYFIFLKTGMLDLALQEWTDRKVNGNLYSPKEGEADGKY